MLTFTLYLQIYVWGDEIERGRGRLNSIKEREREGDVEMGQERGQKSQLRSLLKLHCVLCHCFFVVCLNTLPAVVLSLCWRLT